jgi:Domain of unknown function (DUF4382)
MRLSKTLVVGLAVGWVACATGTGPQLGRLVVRLSDAPAPALSSANIWISSVYLIGSDGSRFTITDSAGVFDVLSLQGGVTALLGDDSIPPGDYTSLHLIVDSARVTLAGGLLFSDGTDSRMMKVPSGPQTGLKVNFGGPIHVAPGETDLVVDFDVARSFVFQGPDTRPHGVLFKPVLHGVVMDQSGSIAGTSTPPAGLGMLFAITGSDTVASAAADATTGAYTLMFLPPGTYTVADSSTATGGNAPSQTVTVGAGEHVTGVDFTLP